MDDLRYLTDPHPALARLLERLPSPSGPGPREWMFLPTPAPCAWCDYPSCTCVFTGSTDPADPGHADRSMPFRHPGATHDYAAHVACDTDQRWDIVLHAARQLAEMLLCSGLAAGRLRFAELRFVGVGPHAMRHASDLLPKHSVDEVFLAPDVAIHPQTEPCMRCGLPTHAEYRWATAAQGPQHFECLEAAWRGQATVSLHDEIRRPGPHLRSVP